MLRSWYQEVSIEAQFRDLAVPDALLQRARAEAALTNRSVDAVLVDWLQRGAPPSDPSYVIYTPSGLDAAAQLLLDALATDKPEDPASTI